MAGLLGYFGMEDWFRSLPEADQAFCRATWLKGLNTCPDDLTDRDIGYSSGSGSRILSGWSATAYGDGHLHLSDILLAKARESSAGGADARAVEAAEALIREMRTRELTISRLVNKMMAFVRNNPGTLQVDLKRLFSSSDSYCLGVALSRMVANDRLRRERKGRTFALYVT